MVAHAEVSTTNVASTNVHYDREPEMFRLFLDRRMKYSAGLYEPGDTLDRAQERKLAWVTSCLELARDKRLLDIGCGWGALLVFAAERHGCHVLGVTPSPRQAEVIRDRARAAGVADLVDVRVSQFQDARLEAGSFDAISLLGSIVHMPDKQAVLNECHRVARPRARLYLSESCFRNSRTVREFHDRPGTRFVRNDIFGWGDLIPVSDYVRHIEEANFSLTGLTDLTANYHRTIEDWQRNAEAHRLELEAIEPGLTDKLIHYFEVSNAGWGFTTKHYALSAIKAR